MLSPPYEVLVAPSSLVYNGHRFVYTPYDLIGWVDTTAYIPARYQFDFKYSTTPNHVWEKGKRK